MRPSRQVRLEGLWKKHELGDVEKEVVTKPFDKRQ